VTNPESAVAAGSILVLPEQLTAEERERFLTALCDRLADGQTVDAAVIQARRTEASNQGNRPIAWYGPKLLASPEPAALVRPE
jgi:hypothetical protein